MTQIAAILYVAIVAGVILFQLCLIAGAPWGHLTQGGRYGPALPAIGRVAAGLSIPLLICMAAGVASAAGMPPNWPMWTAWAALTVQALSTLLNWITPSRAEKLLWGPVTAVMLVLAVYAVLDGSL
jgi:hypothetical protein